MAEKKLKKHVEERLEEVDKNIQRLKKDLRAKDVLSNIP